MGLAGPRKRTKISHDPNNTNWSRSVNGFGHKILTAQGWTPGTFLGAKSAPYAQLHSTASASHIRVVLKDDNLGLGAKRGGGEVEGECTGLSAFQGLLGRLNGRTEEEVNKEQKAREAIRRETYMENRWGLIKFVRGGFLVGDEIQELVDDEAGRLQVLTVTEGKTAEDASGGSELLEGMERRKPKEQYDGGSDGGRWPTHDEPNGVQIREKKAKSKISIKKPHSDAIKSVGTEAQERKRKIKRKQRSSPIHSMEDQTHAIRQASITTAITQLSTNSSLSPSKKEKRENRRLERHARKNAKRQATKEQVLGGEWRERSEQSSSVQDPLFGVDATRPEKIAASSLIPTNTLPGGRHAVRQRYIQQKKMALLDVQALNEVCRVYSEQLLAYADYGYN
ncbi:MAG: telomerase inhibitor [Trichoglossum hirsutum]|nr:MAG: telomerase inhibitor [Trichoglossum hirsutum]